MEDHLMIKYDMISWKMLKFDAKSIILDLIYNNLYIYIYI